MALDSEVAEDRVYSSKGKLIQSTAQMMIRNCEQFFRRESETASDVYEWTAMALDITHKTVKWYASSSQEPCTPAKWQKKSRPITEIDKFTKDCLRRLMYEQYSHNVNITLDSLLDLVRRNNIGFYGAIRHFVQFWGMLDFSDKNIIGEKYLLSLRIVLSPEEGIYGK